MARSSIQIERDLAWNQYNRMMVKIGARWPHHLPFSIVLSPKREVVNVQIIWAGEDPRVSINEMNVFKAHCDEVLDPFREANMLNDPQTLHMLRQAMFEAFIVEHMYPGLTDISVTSYKEPT